MNRIGRTEPPGGPPPPTACLSASGQRIGSRPRRQGTSLPEPGPAPGICSTSYPRRARPAGPAEGRKQEQVAADTAERQKSAAVAADIVEEHRMAAAVVDTAAPAASQLGGGMAFVAPRVEPALDTLAPGASPGVAEEPREPPGSHSPRAEPPGERLAAGVGPFGGLQRDLCIRPVGEAGAEAAPAVRWVGAQRLAAQEAASGAAAGTFSYIRRAPLWQGRPRAEDLAGWAGQDLGRPVGSSATYSPASTG